ncbi:MAG TPA: putative 2-dehydropantoate 2-reductase [Bacteroidales bacterium]|nr:putative 2-dehydropantoate 2-reductase [Bacteroidales bacterium]
MNKLRYGVIGTGGIGGFYGGMLAHSGQEVHFLFHSDFDFVKKHGLKVDSVLGDFHLEKVHAYQSTEDMPICDVVLVGLKTTSNSLLKTLLPPLLGPETTVILIQNGLGIEEKLSVDFPDLSIAGGLGFICSGKFGPGHIVHAEHGKITIGSYQGSQQEILKKVCADFEAARVPCEVSENLLTSRWKKLVWNVPYNGLTVVMNALTSDLMANADTYQLCKDLMLEVIGAANACGVSLSKDFAQVMLEYTLDMKPYAPSMRLDFDFKRPMEIQAIYSSPLEAADNVGFDMPKVRMLEQQLRFIQQTYL